MPASDNEISRAIGEVYEYLNKIPISALLKHRRERKGGDAPLIAVTEESTIANVMTVLRNEGILAVPVYRQRADGQIFTGIVSIYDILAYTVFQKVLDELDTKFVGADAQQLKEWINMLMEEQEVYFSKKVGELVGLTRESQESWTVHSSNPISTILQLLTTGYHRVLVSDEEAFLESSKDYETSSATPEGSSITMVTQTDLMHFLLETDVAPDAITRILKLPAKELNELAARRSTDVNPNQARTGESTTRVVTVADSSTALQAFRVMYLNRVSAVAVVDQEGAVAANLSASDLRGISVSNLDQLLDNVYTFLEVDTRRRADQVKADQLKSVEPDTLVEAAVAIMLESHIHRVWIVEEGDKPVGVVTLSDVLNIFVPNGMMAVEK